MLGVRSGSNQPPKILMSKKRVVVRKKKVAKKKTAAGASPSSYSSSYKEPKLPGEGFSIMSLIMLLVTLALIGLVVVVFLPPDMSSVKGYPYNKAEASDPPRNLLREAEDVWVKGEGSIEFSEADINTYLNQRLVVKQGGMFGSFTKVQGIYMDLEEDKATLYVVRTVFGMPLVIDTTWEMFLSNEEYIRRCTGSGVGKLSFGEKMFAPIMKPFFSFTKEMNREQKVLFDESVSRVKLAKDSLRIEY